MATTTKVKLKPIHLDTWSNKEKLALACSVLKSGDQNWVSVSRAIKPYGETDRPAEWFSQKNCALQYSDLLEKVETPKRKRGDDGVVETPSIQIVRKLTIERIEELKKKVVEEQQRYKKLKKDVEYIKSGQWDDKLIEVWDKVQAEKRASEDPAKEVDVKEEEVAASVRADQLASIRGRNLQIPPSPHIVSQTGQTEQEDSTRESTLGFLSLDISKALEEEISSGQTLAVPSTVLSSDVKQKHPPTSPLLSSLLQSKFKSADSLQQLKNEAEQAEQALSQQLSNQQAAALEALANQQKEQSAPPQIRVTIAPPTLTQPDSLPTSPSCAAPTLSKLLNIQPGQKPPVTAITSTTTSPTISPAKTSLVVEEDAVVLKLDEKPLIEDVHVEVVCTEETEIESVPEPGVGAQKDLLEEISVKEEVEVKTEEKINEIVVETEVKDEVDKESVDEEDVPSFFSVDEEVSIKEEPQSPASSVSSKISETGGKLHIRHRRKKGRSNHKKGGRVTRRSIVEDDRKDDASSKHSETDLTDEETRESDDALGIDTTISTMPSLFCESIPNSPASLSMCSDSEDEKAFKMWKKSIMLVWRSAATHKYASVFLHPVSNDIAPGYNTVVHRSMDLGTIKKNIESGIIRTTSEFQRDMMLMFTNAIMYNSSNHNVFRLAMEMYDDVMEHIKQYVSTQLMVQTTDTKNLRQSRRSEAQEDEAKKRRPSQDPPQDGGKSKKRKTRGDDT